MLTVLYFSVFPWTPATTPNRSGHRLGPSGAEWSPTSPGIGTTITLFATTEKVKALFRFISCFVCSSMYYHRLVVIDGVTRLDQLPFALAFNEP